MILEGWLGGPTGGPAATAVEAALGILLLVFGRRLFWLAIGSLGFAVGFSLAQLVVGDDSVAGLLAVGIVIGAAGALLAVLLQRVAVLAAGALLGALAAAAVLSQYSVTAAGLEVAIVLAGGLVGAALSFGIFGFALRLVTAAVGSALVTRALGLPPDWALGLFAVLWAIGFLAQGDTSRPEGARR